MSFPCSHKSCHKVFRTQNATDQHFFSFHNKAEYDATVKASQIKNEERRQQEREEARMQLEMGNKPAESQLSRIENLLGRPDLSFSETVLQKNGYHEPPRFNGQSDPRFVAQNMASEMGPPSRLAPLASTSHDQDRSSRRSSMLNTETQRVSNYASPSTTASEIPQYEYYENDAYFSYGLDNGAQKYHPELELLPCEDCSFVFRDQESLDYHISTKHQPPPCFVCHKPFPHDQTLDEHLETVPHECAYCHISLPSRKSGVVSHMWFSHPFVCRECGCSLPNSSALGRHMSTVHGNGGIRCQVCHPPCGRTFDTQEALDGHNRSVMNGNSGAVGTRRSEYGGTAQWVSQDQARRRAREEKSSVPESSRSSRRSRRGKPVRHEEGTSELGSPPRLAARHRFHPLITENPPQPSTRRKKDLSVAGSSAGSTTHHTEISPVSGRFSAVVRSDENRFRCNCGSNTCVMSCEGSHHIQTDIPPMEQAILDSQPIQPIQSIQPIQPARRATPMQPIQPLQPTQRATPIQSIQPLQPTRRATPIQPIQPTRRATPAQPVQLAKTAQSNQSDHSDHSDRPDRPNCPDYPDQLSLPAKLVQQAQPVRSKSPISSLKRREYPTYPCWTCHPFCGNIFNTEEAKEAHIKSVSLKGKSSMRLDTNENYSELLGMSGKHSELLSTNEKPPSPATRRCKTLFLCESCDPACNQIFEVRESLIAHIEQRTRLDIQNMEADIRSAEKAAQIRTKALEKKLEEMKETHRLEIEAMNTDLKSVRERIFEIDTQILPSFSCDLCKPFCGYIFDTEEAVERHLDMVLDNAIDTRLKSLREKDAFDTKKGKFPMKCSTCTPSCGSTLDSPEYLNQHLDLMIEKSQHLITRYSKQEFPCNKCDPSCGMIFDCKEDLEAHMIPAAEALEVVEITEPQAAPKTDCESQTETLVDLESPQFHDKSMRDFHRILEDHNARKKQTEQSILDIVDQFSCDTCSPQCGRIFNTEEELQNHQNFIEEKFLRNPTRPSIDRWSWLIIETPDAVETLLSMTHEQDILLENEYFEPPQNFSHQDQIKCIHCHGVKSKLDLEENVICSYHTGRWEKDGDKTRPSCCKKRIKGCKVQDKHTFINTKNFGEPRLKLTPTPSFLHPKRKAVVLGCGVGVSAQATSELIQLVVIDFFTGEVLIDMIVRPRKQMVDYRTRWTGVTKDMVQNAIAAGEFLDSFENARAELLKWIDSQTILIGHSLNMELWQLQLRHHLVIDLSLAIPQAGYVPLKRSKGKNLKAILQNFLGDIIQDDIDGYDLLENLRGVRELIIRLSGGGTAINADYEEEEVSENY
ncbi:hypothetical protein DFP73DRAFT_298219 [Morchella snyderi]|nr:hypothetical protein DFP73DRAFT_298219 [Morchella snyderi]